MELLTAKGDKVLLQGHTAPPGARSPQLTDCGTALKSSEQPPGLKWGWRTSHGPELNVQGLLAAAQKDTKLI